MEPAERQQDLVDGHFETAADYWKEIYEARTVYGTIHRERTATALRWIDELALPVGTEVLEVGCGAGLTSVALAERGLAVTATDNSPAMVELASKLAQDRELVGIIHASVVDVHNLPFEDNSFSIAVALGVLPWLHSPEQALLEIVRVLRPRGIHAGQRGQPVSAASLARPAPEPDGGPGPRSLARVGTPPPGKAWLHGRSTGASGSTPQLRPRAVTSRAVQGEKRYARLRSLHVLGAARIIGRGWNAPPSEAPAPG